MYVILCYIYINYAKFDSLQTMHGEAARLSGKLESVDATTRAATT